MPTGMGAARVGRRGVEASMRDQADGGTSGIGGGVAPAEGTILEQFPVAVCVTDRHGEPVFANARAVELLGRGVVVDARPVAERYGLLRRGAQRYPEEALPVRRALRDGGPVIVDDLEVRRPDGHVVPVEVLADVLRDGAGQVCGAVAIFWDVTTQRAARRDRSLLSAIVGSAAVALVAVDGEGRIASWSEGATTAYGYGADEAVGRSFALFTPFRDAGAPARVRRALDGERVEDVELTRVRADGSEVVVEETLAPVFDHAGASLGLVSLARDVTARRRAQDELVRARGELERTLARLERANAELDELASVVSHDLSEPLRAVGGMVQLLERRYRGRFDDDADEFLALAVDGCNRMKGMLDEVLAYSRAGRIAPSAAPVDLRAVAAAAVASLHDAIREAGANVVVRPLPTVPGNADALRPVLQQLIGNAVKFHAPGVAPRVEVSATRDGAGWTVCVADDGIGVDPQHAARIFRMFQRLHGRDAYPGSGMGLAITQRLVHGFGGRLWVESPHAGGSRFCFSIPEAGEAAA